MTAALDADLEAEGTGIAHRRDDVVHAGALHDHARAAVDHRVPHLARCVVALVVGQQNPPCEVLPDMAVGHLALPDSRQPTVPSSGELTQGIEIVMRRPLSSFGRPVIPATNGDGPIRHRFQCRRKKLSHSMCAYVCSTDPSGKVRVDSRRSDSVSLSGVVSLTPSPMRMGRTTRPTESRAWILRNA